MKVINLTPHAIALNSGEKHEPTGALARVSSSYTSFDADGTCDQVFGDIIGLPSPSEGVVYLVSAMVLTAAKAQGRTDCIAPATGHPDCIRNEQGHIVSVPGFVR